MTAKYPKKCQVYAVLGGDILLENVVDGIGYIRSWLSVCDIEIVWCDPGYQ